MGYLSGQAIDRDAVHRVLYRRANRHHRIKINAWYLAEDLGVSYWNFTQLLHRMMDEGRLRQLGGSNGHARTFLVVDPTTYKAPERRRRTRATT